eukprot:857547_1
MKLTWFAANVVVVALTFQFLVRSVTLSDLPNDATPIQWRCSCGFPFNLISVPICNFCESKQSELTLEDIVESSDTDLPNDATPIQWRCSCGFPFNLISVPICNFCESKQSELTLEDIAESSDTGLASTSWECICGFKIKLPSASKCIICKHENIAFDLHHSCEPSNAEGLADTSMVTESDSKGSGDYTDDIISTEKDKADGSTTGDDIVTINSVDGKKENADDSMGILAVSLICCLCLFCLASIVGVQRIIFTQHSSEYQSLEYEPLTDEQVNTDTVIEVNEEEEHRLPPDSRDYATEVCRSVCLASVCCAAWIIVPYYHWKERRQRRRENNLTRSQELL